MAKLIEGAPWLADAVDNVSHQQPEPDQRGAQQHQFTDNGRRIPQPHSDAPSLAEPGETEYHAE
jgi:hypothetical protein